MLKSNMDPTTNLKLRGCAGWVLLCLVSAFQLFSVSAFGVTNVVTFQLKNFTSDPVTTRKVLVAPTAVASPSGALAVADRRIITTDTNASFLLTNMLPGTYGVTVQGPPQTTAFAILVGTNSGTFNAHDLLVVDTNATSPPDSVAWSTTASDARYEPIGGTTTAYATNAGSAQYAGIATNLLGVSNIVTRAELAGSNYLTAALAASQIAASNLLNAAQVASQIAGSNLLNAAQAASQIAGSNLLTAPQVASQIAASNLLNVAQVGAQVASSNYMPAAQTSFTNVTLYGTGGTNWTTTTGAGWLNTNTGTAGSVRISSGNVTASGTLSAASNYVSGGAYLAGNIGVGTPAGAVAKVSISGPLVLLDSYTQTSAVAFATAPMAGEIRGIDSPTSDYGFLRLSAGGWGSTAHLTGIDLQGNGGAAGGTYGSDYIRFFLGNFERMRITKDGYLGLGLGASRPAVLFDANGSGRFTNSLDVGNTLSVSNYAGVIRATGTSPGTAPAIDIPAWPSTGSPSLTVLSGGVAVTNGLASYRTTTWTASDLGTNGFGLWHSNNAIYVSLWANGNGTGVTNRQLLPDF